LRAIARGVDLARRHSSVVNFIRNAVQLLRGRRVALDAWLVIDGNFTLGSGATISHGCHINVPQGGSCDLGPRVHLFGDTHIDVLGSVVVGDGTTIQRGCTLVGDVEIGRGCLFAPRVFVSSGMHNFDLVPAMPIRLQDALASSDPRQSARRSRPVRIDDDCWIGVNAVLMPGITIGRGSVIGANAVVTTDVPPYTVVGGVPARRLRARLDFQPPRVIDGADPMHRPYFYSGFQQDDLSPPVADRNFVLALDMTQAAEVVLTLRAVERAVNVSCNGSVTAIPVGDAVEVVAVPVEAERDQKRLYVTLLDRGRVAVLRAAVISRKSEATRIGASAPSASGV
jgi:acetyltransferase-like isoleucine patch superfamily enzyme